jgi:hypothetical protein
MCLSRVVSRRLLGSMTAGTRFQHFHFDISQLYFTKEGLQISRPFFVLVLVCFEYFVRPSVHPFKQATCGILTQEVF